MNYSGLIKSTTNCEEKRSLSDCATSGFDKVPESKGFWTKGAIQILYHRSLRNRQLRITLDDEQTVLEGSQSSTGEWIVPCDLTGLYKYVADGSKPQKKPIRIRFNPGTLVKAEMDQDLAHAVEKAAKELLLQILGNDWMLEKPLLPDVRQQHIHNLRHIFLTNPGKVIHTCESLIFVWIFGTAAESALSCDSIKSSLCLQLSSEENGVQVVGLHFVKDDLNEPLLRIQIYSQNDSSGWLSKNVAEHQIHLNVLHLQLNLQRAHLDEPLIPVQICPRIELFTFHDNGKSKCLITMDLQKRLEELRRYLDDGIKAYQCRQKALMSRNRSSSNSSSSSSSSSSGNSCGSGGRSATSTNPKSRRILHMLYQDEASACVQITGTVMTKNAVAEMVASKVPYKADGIFGKKELLMKSPITPLQVIVGVGSQQQHPGLISSPAGSVDSGMSSLSSSNSSPVSSPGCSSVSNRITPFHYGAEQHTRIRSTSESLSATNGLKSILKKSTPTYITMGRFTRSYSECQSIEEEDLKVIVIDVGNEEDNAGCTPRKKHVSFSERLVQERSFRPNSSILGQKKKNQRKQKNKLKRKSTSFSEDSSTDDEARRRSDGETSRDTICSENKDDEIDPICRDVIACELEDAVVVEEDDDDDDEEEKEHPENCREAAAKIRQRILRSSTGEEQRVYFTVGDEKCQC